MKSSKNIFLLFISLLLILFLLFYGETGLSLNSQIITELRIPKILACFFAGGLLAVAGLLMQIYFQNPLAGPDILGISSGSVLLVAIWTMATSALPKALSQIGINIVSFFGSFLVFILLIFFMRKQRTKMTILIIGILISSFVSSIVSILINSSQALQVKTYLLWSQGSFRNLTSSDLVYFISLSLITLIPVIVFKKAFNQISIGENYAKSMGVNLKLTKYIFVLTSALSVSVITVYCGPVGFVGIIAPYIAKRFLRKTNLTVLLPSAFLIGTILTLFAEAVLTSFPSIPFTVNTILGLIGAPILVYFVYEQKEVLI